MRAALSNLILTLVPDETNHHELSEKITTTPAAFSTVNKEAKPPTTSTHPDSETKDNFTGPPQAAPLRALSLRPLLSGAQASSIAAHNATEATQITDRLYNFRTNPSPVHDVVFDTALPTKPREVDDKTIRQAKKEQRQLKAILEFVIRSKRRLTLDIFVPNLTFWQSFSDETLLETSLYSISDYASILNRFAGQLAIQLGSRHELHASLVANNNLPWTDAPFAAITGKYAAAQAAARASQAETSTGAESVDDEHKAFPAPTYLLDKLLHQAQELMRKHAALQASVQQATRALNLANPRFGGARKASKHMKTQKSPAATVKAHASTLKEAKKALNTAESHLGGYASSFLQVFFMARASSIAGGLIHNRRGITADISFNPGLSYTMRFMKSWDFGVTEGPSGEKLPLHYSGATAIPWETNSVSGLLEPANKSKRNAALSIIQFAHKGRMLDFLNVKNPGTRGYQVINKFLKRINASDLLNEADQIIDSRRQHITSHSLRKAGASLALASGVRAENIRQWVHWRDPSMTWTYTSASYQAPMEWKSFFAFMLELPHQNT